MYEIDMDIYRHLRAMEKLVDMRFPYYGIHFPEEEISDDEREELHELLKEMEKGYNNKLRTVGGWWKDMDWKTWICYIEITIIDDYCYLGGRQLNRTKDTCEGCIYV